MANQLLAKTSMAFGALNIAFMLFWNTRHYLMAVYIVGIATSIWNHGTTSNLAKWADRVWMFYGAVSDITVLIIRAFSPGYFLLFGAICCYFTAKQHESCK